MLIILLSGATWSFIIGGGKNPGHFYPHVDHPLVRFELYYNGFAIELNMLISIMFAYYLKLRRQASKESMLFLVFTGLSIIAVILSVSRAGWISLLLIAISWAFYLVRSIKVSKAAVISAMLVVLLILTALIFSVPTARNR
ncbi:MAG: hypothetical protein JSV21_03015, partial [Nitrospirota bacterium]